MRKSVMILCMVCVVLLITACDTQTDITSNQSTVMENSHEMTTDQKKHTSIMSGEVLEDEGESYISADMEAFISDLKNIHQGKGNVSDVLGAGTTSNTKTITVPVLQTSTYQFKFVLVNEHYYFYYYCPVGETGTTVNHDVDIEVSVPKYNSGRTLSSVADLYQLTVVNDAAYYAQKRTWFVADGNNTISIRFPKNIVVSEASVLSEYFTFDKVQLGTGGSNDHVAE